MVRDRSNIPELQARLAKASADAVDATGKRAINRVDTGFNRGEDAMGAPWQELADATIAEKGHAKKLIDESLLKNSVTYITDRTEAITRIGSNDPKAVYHEVGVPQNGLPARPIFTPMANWIVDEGILEDEVVDHVNVAIARSSL